MTHSDEAMSTWSWLQMQTAVTMIVLPATVHNHFDAFMDNLLRMNGFPHLQKNFCLSKYEARKKKERKKNTDANNKS